MMNDCPHCQELRDEIEVLKRALGSEIPLPLQFKFSRTEEKMVRVLLARNGVVSQDQMMDAVYSLEMNSPEPQVVHVFLCRIRKRLKPHDIEIHTVWGRGWHMTADDKAKMAALVESERSVAAN